MVHANTATIFSNSCISEALPLWKNKRNMIKLWRSGMILSSAGLLAGLGNYAFQAIIGHQLDKAEFGYVNFTLGFIGLLSLPLQIGTVSLTHYIAHYRAKGDEARLQGLLAGCRKFLFRLTLGGSLAAVALLKPLSVFFEFPRAGLMLVALFCVLAGLWAAFGTALCQGLAWFRRLALISLVMVALRLAFGSAAVAKYRVAEAAVMASGIAFLANLVLLYWRKEFMGSRAAISPYNREFFQYLAVGAACMTGAFFFTQGDVLVAKRNFSATDLGLYSAAGKLAQALPMVVAPMLTVLFTSRSAHRTEMALREQLKLLGLYAAGLAGGAAGLLLLRGFWVKLIFGAYTPESAAMVGRVAVAMVFIGLMQAMGLWSLASRWFKLALLYGVSGVAYWVVLLHWGKSPEKMLDLMPVAAACAFGLMLIAWLATMRTSHSESIPAAES
jgi:O-antigen/teichoic acid export membrane protein